MRPNKSKKLLKEKKKISFGRMSRCAGGKKATAKKASYRSASQQQYYGL